MLPRIANFQPDRLGLFILSQLVNVPVSATGDILINGASPLFINASRVSSLALRVWNPQVNGAPVDISGTIAFGVFTLPGATGATVVANSAQSVNSTASNGAIATGVAQISGTALQVLVGPAPLYINVGTALAGATINITVQGLVLQL